MKAPATKFAPGRAQPGTRLRHLALLSAAATTLLVSPLAAQTPAPGGTPAPSGQAAPTTPPSTPPSTPPATPPAGTAQPGQPPAPGIRAVNPATLQITFYTVRPADMLASNLIGLDVHNLQNEEIGEIEDLVVDEGKTIRGIVIGIGGFLGIGERRTVVEPGSIVVTRDPGGAFKAVANTTREDLKKAPEFKFEGNMSRPK